MIQIQIPLMTVTTMTARMEEETLEPEVAVQARADTEAEVDHLTDHLTAVHHRGMTVIMMMGVRGVGVKRSPTDLLHLIHQTLMMMMIRLTVLEKVIGI